MTDSASPYEYEVAISFAYQDRRVAEELASLLLGRGRTVFMDEFTPDQNWGQDVLDHLVNLYARRARYCLLLISRHYPLKQWTETERRQTGERALRDAEQYILPIQLDDSEVPGLSQAPGYRNTRYDSLADVANDLEEKLSGPHRPEGPPSQSHDLRSGNVPPAQEASG